MRYFWLFLLIPGLLKAEVLPDKSEGEIIDDFSGGLNTAVSLQKVPKDMSPNIRNLLIDKKPGSLVQRKGFIIAGSSRVFNSGNGITGIYPFYSEDGTTKFLVTDSSTVLETQDFNSWNFVGSGFTSTVLMRCIQARNKMWCSNGFEPNFTWDSSTRVTLNGTVGTPNVPKFKYMIYYQDRVFGLNTSANGSSLDYSAIVSTENRILAPDDFLAWPAINRVNVGQGDGQVGQGLWVQDGLLRVAKQNSIYTIYGTEPYIPKKTDSQVGLVSNDSVVILDGNAYFIGPNGIYENLRRISDAFAPDIDTFQRDTTRVLDKTWDTQNDFSAGSFIHGSTATVDGLLTIQKPPYAINSNPDISMADSGIELASSSVHNGVSGTTTTGNSFISFDQSVMISTNIPFIGYVDRIELFMNHFGPNPSATCTARVSILNTRTNLSEFVDHDVHFGANGGSTPNLEVFTFRTGNVLFTGKDIAISSMQIKVEYHGGEAERFRVAKPTVTSGATIILNPATTVQFISEVSTFAVVTAWGTFDSARNTNGGAINYYLRTSTSSVNIATQTWMQVTPGVIVNAPLINNFIQWASTITSVSTFTNTANINNVTISHIEGAGSISRPFATDWDNRYWLSVATETSANFSLIYVKAKSTNPKPDAFVLFDGINIRSFGKDRTNTLYGGSVSTGIVYRLDYGTNDNGNIITPVYETPGLAFGENYFNKTVSKVLLDGQKTTGGTLKFGISVDGSDFTERSISIDGSGRYTNVIQGIDPKSGKVHRYRLKMNQLDKEMVFDNLTPIYSVEPVLK